MALRCQAAKANSFTQVPGRLHQKNNEEVSDWYHASKYWLFATIARLFSSPRPRSRCLPSFASRRRLLGLCRRSFRTPDCRSGVDLDNLGAKKDHEEMLANKVKAWHRRRRVGPQTERTSQLSRAKACAGWAPHWLHSHAQPARWIYFGSFAKACRGKSFYSRFLLFLEHQRAHKYYSLTKNQKRTTLPSTTSDRQTAWVKRKNVCNQRRDEMARTWKHIIFPSKTQNRQIARTSPVIFAISRSRAKFCDFAQTNVKDQLWNRLG